MSPQIASVPAHPEGEGSNELQDATREVLVPALPVDTEGRRVHVEWDPFAPVTQLGQLVFFCQFLATSGLYSKWIANCPLRYASPNAPTVRDVLGTAVLGILSGACRYAHVTALRGDQVNPQGLGMEKVVSEDSLRRAFQDEDSAALAQWQTEAQLETYAPALEQPWIADLDVTIYKHGHRMKNKSGAKPAPLSEKAGVEITSRNRSDQCTICDLSCLPRRTGGPVIRFS